jgi:hypothetical protein
MTLAPAKVRRTTILVDLLVVGVALCAFAGVGFLVGRSNQISADTIANARTGAWAAGYSPARASAYRLGWQGAYDGGRVAGTASGTAAGTRAGRSAGLDALARRTSAAHLASLAAALVATRINLTRATRIRRCVEVGLGLCEALGPGATGKRCPPQSVPVPVGGVTCIPRILLLAARQH